MFIVFAGVLSSLPAEALCANLAAPHGHSEKANAAASAAAATTLQAATAAEAEAQRAAARRPEASEADALLHAGSWTLLVDGALASAMDAAAMPPDAHHRLLAVSTLAAALEKVEQVLKVGIKLPSMQSMQDPKMPKMPCRSLQIGATAGALLDVHSAERASVL